MKNHLLEKLHPFSKSSKPNRKKDMGLLRSGEAKKFKKKGLGYFVRMHERFGMIPRETKQTFLKFMAATYT